MIDRFARVSTPSVPAALRRRSGLAFAFLLLLVPVLVVPGVAAQETDTRETDTLGGEAKGLPTVAETTEGLEHRPGLLDLWIDADAGTVWLEVPAPADDAERGAVGSYLYVEGLVTGLGSNPVGLDRGQIGPTRLVTLRHVGAKVMLEVDNLGFRADSPDRAEREAVRQSFAPAVLWAGDAVAEDPDGSVLVDFTSFLVRDAHGVTRQVERAGQGTYRLDPARSAVDLDAVLAFPENLEFEALLTYAAQGDPGRLVASTSSLPDAFTLVQHHSLVKLPDPGYRPRRFDPRAGSYAVSWQDYAVPLDEPIERRFLVRHRLEKVDPSAPSSPVVEPLVYHLDRGAPEPVRSALIEGAAWWAEAFEAAGFEDAFRVELLPEDAHPLDVRYNVIQWVHRSTRGWSYGGGVIDPRSGEMIKGHVSLGSLRVRQDRLIFEGLLGVGETGSGSERDPIELSLARIRQLSAHEVGHTLGLIHNFAASTYDGRASVMDYPAPLVTVGADGRLDVSKAYGVGVGSWDRFAIRFAHAEPPAGEDEAAFLDRLAAEAVADGLLLLTDQDARPPGAAQPDGSLWDNGADPVEHLETVLAVRRAALEGFGTDNLADGRPVALLEEVLAPIYFYHRYQVDAAVKAVGGLDYRHAIDGDGQTPVRPVAAERQRRALELLLSALEPAELDLPESVLALLAPRPPGYEPNRELFGGRTDPGFDALGAAGTAASVVISGLLQPERAARLVDQHRRDPSLPSLGEVLETLTRATFPEDDDDLRHQTIRRVVQTILVEGLIDLASDSRVTPLVQGHAEMVLAGMVQALDGARFDGFEEGVHQQWLADSIRRFLERNEDRTAPRPEPLDPPPGSPIGSPDPAVTPFGAGCFHG